MHGPRSRRQAGSSRIRSPRVTTTGDGAFELDDLPPGTWSVAWIRRQGETTVEDLQTRVVVPPGKVCTLELQARGNATLRGRLRFPGHDLPAVVPVRLFPQPGNAERAIRGVLARNGFFEFPRVEAGGWSVIAYPGASVSASTRLDIEVPAEGVVEAELVLEPAR